MRRCSSEVEDEGGVRRLIERVLGRAGYRVLLAEDGQEAIRMFEENQASVGLLLTDVVLPKVAGPQVAAALRKRAPDLPVLFMSGYTDQSIARRGVLDLGVHFLEKPLRPNALLDKIREVLEGP